MTKPISIYVIGSDRGPKKVGLAGNPRRRLLSIQNGNPQPLKLLHECQVNPDLAPSIERRTHWLLREKRVAGEWFKVEAGRAIEAIAQAVAEGGDGEKGGYAVGRPKLWAERLHVTLPEGAKARIAAALREGEDMLDLIREAIERELKRRERREGK